MDILTAFAISTPVAAIAVLAVNHYIKGKSSSIIITAVAVTWIGTLVMAAENQRVVATCNAIKLFDSGRYVHFGGYAINKDKGWVRDGIYFIKDDISVRFDPSYETQEFTELSDKRDSDCSK